MPSLKKGKKQGKSHFVAGRSWILLTKCISHEAFWKHPRLDCQSTLVASQTPGNFLEFLQQLLQEHLSATQTFGSAAVKYFNSRISDSHFNCGVLVLNPSKLLFTKTTFCYSLRQSSCWRKPEDPTRASLCLVASPRGISGCAKGDHKELSQLGEQKLCSPAENHFVFLPCSPLAHGNFMKWSFMKWKMGKFRHSLAGEGAPKDGKHWKKAASSSIAQLLLEPECILCCSTNILQQSLFVWLVFLVLRTYL